MPDIRLARPSGTTMRAFLALPEGAGPWPAVIVIHEIFGLNDDIREKAARLARMGYVALAPDLYDGRGNRFLCVLRTMRSLSHGGGDAIADLEMARAHLASRPEVDASRLGVVGFCLGGGFALLYASKAELGAAAVFYGAVPKDETLLDTVCPVVGGYGGRDTIFRKQGRRLRTALATRDIPNDILIYQDAGHSYMSDHKGLLTKASAHGPMRVGFNPEAAEDSWRRVEAFFAEHLTAAR
ncbi:MAG: carboxymethylenebutenolidase [Anaerolinea sp.]|nr:carboxymethylenebutenolidase [Anaerolinea sp.]